MWKGGRGREGTRGRGREGGEEREGKRGRERREGTRGREEMEGREGGMKHTVRVSTSSSPYLAGSRQDHVGAVYCHLHGL